MNTRAAELSGGTWTDDLRGPRALVHHPGVKWMGVDVGAERKGFDVAVIDDLALLVLRGRLNCADVVSIAEEVKPLVVGVDSPCTCAPAGATSRRCERELAKTVCGIRWTPDAAAVAASPYYAWVVHGLRLYATLASLEPEVIEVFPTASWTRWLGERGPRRRSAWTKAGLPTLGLSAVPLRTNQDQRDAIAAAVTARQHSARTTESFGEIVVPRSPSRPSHGPWNYASVADPARVATP